MISQASPRSNDKVKQKVIEILESGQYVKGPEAELFEEKFQKTSATKFNYTCNSGTSALNLIFEAMDYPEGSNIIVPPNSFMASANAVETSRYNTKFCDVDEGHLNLDPSKLEDCIDENTKAILVVHLYGTPAPMNEILAIAKKHQLDVFEDSAQAHGAEYEGKKIGSFGLASAFSLFPTKNLSVLGDGGIVCTNDKDLGRKFAALRNAGRTEDPNDAEFFGYNFRLSEILAGIGNVLIEGLEEETSRRQTIAERYSVGLQGVGDIVLPKSPENSEPVYHQYTIRTNKRDELRSYLKSKEIGSSVKYSVPIHLLSVYKDKYGHKEGDFPVSENASKTLLCLPMHPHLSDDDVEKVIEEIKSFYT